MSKTSPRFSSLATSLVSLTNKYTPAPPNLSRTYSRTLGGATRISLGFFPSQRGGLNLRVSSPTYPDGNGARASSWQPQSSPTQIQAPWNQLHHRSGQPYSVQGRTGRISQPDRLADNMLAKRQRFESSNVRGWSSRARLCFPSCVQTLVDCWVRLLLVFAVRVLPCTTVTFTYSFPPPVGVQNHWCKSSSLLAAYCFSKTTIAAVRKPAESLMSSRSCELVDYASTNSGSLNITGNNLKKLSSGIC
jgi:hypothetical protein